MWPLPFPNTLTFAAVTQHDLSNFVWLHFFFSFLVETAGAHKFSLHLMEIKFTELQISSTCTTAMPLWRPWPKACTILAAVEHLTSFCYSRRQTVVSVRVMLLLLGLFIDLFNEGGQGTLCFCLLQFKHQPIHSYTVSFSLNLCWFDIFTSMQ